MDVIAIVLFAEPFAAQSAFEWIIFIPGMLKLLMFSILCQRREARPASVTGDRVKKGNGVGMQTWAAVADMLFLLSRSQECTSTCRATILELVVQPFTPVDMFAQVSLLVYHPRLALRTLSQLLAVAGLCWAHHLVNVSRLNFGLWHLAILAVN